MSYRYEASWIHYDQSFSEQKLIQWNLILEVSESHIIDSFEYY